MSHLYLPAPPVSTCPTLSTCPTCIYKVTSSTCIYLSYLIYLSHLYLSIPYGSTYPTYIYHQMAQPRNTTIMFTSSVCWDSPAGSVSCESVTCPRRDWAGTEQRSSARGRRCAAVASLWTAWSPLHLASTSAAHWSLTADIPWDATRLKQIVTIKTSIHLTSPEWSPLEDDDWSNYFWLLLHGASW